MDVIDLSSYTQLEKENIFKNYLLPKTLEESGLTGEEFEMADDVIHRLIEEYCREPGVRSLERYTRRIIDKVAFKIISGKKSLKKKKEKI